MILAIHPSSATRNSPNVNPRRQQSSVAFGYNIQAPQSERPNKHLREALFERIYTLGESLSIATEYSIHHL
jgi:hypothetical protein